MNNFFFTHIYHVYFDTREVGQVYIKVYLLSIIFQKKIYID